MQNLELPLFPIDTPRSNTSHEVPIQDQNEPHFKIDENIIATPLAEVLEGIIPQAPNKLHSDKEPSKSLKESLDTLFPEQQYEEKSIQTAKEILGPIAKEYTQEELKCVVAELQYLAESWLDDFERDIFNGLTLKELLHEKGRT